MQPQYAFARMSTIGERRMMSLVCQLAPERSRPCRLAHAGHKLQRKMARQEGCSKKHGKAQKHQVTIHVRRKSITLASWLHVLAPTGKVCQAQPAATQVDPASQRNHRNQIAMQGAVFRASRFELTASHYTISGFFATLEDPPHGWASLTLFIQQQL